jgi:importin subunit alpha-2
MQVELMRNTTWTISCLCRKDFKITAVQQIFPTLALLLDCNDQEILVNICTTFTYLKEPQEIQSVVDAGVLPRLVALLNRKEVEILTPLHEIIQNFVRSSETIQGLVLASGANELLVNLMNNSHF